VLQQSSLCQTEIINKDDTQALPKFKIICSTSWSQREPKLQNISES